MEKPEQDLVARMAESRDDAWSDFQDSYGARIFSFARSWGLQDADAQDVMQNVLVNISRSIENFELDDRRGTFWNWISTITHREILRHFERHERASRKLAKDVARRKISIRNSRSVRSSEALRRLYHTALARTQAACHHRDWCVFRSIWIDHEEPLQVAERQGQTLQWVYRAKFRVMEHLRHEVDLLTEDSVFAEI